MKKITVFFVCIVLLSSCVTGKKAKRKISVNENPGVVSIRSGVFHVHGLTSLNVYYGIDKHTEVCFITLNESVAEIDCCKVRKLPKAAKHMPWLNDTVCKK
ncbi:MAG: hypothetical protein GY754_21475 [bacterium]|nr:hypothetical protein [bacterium]